MLDGMLLAAKYQQGSTEGQGSMWGEEDEGEEVAAEEVAEGFDRVLVAKLVKAAKARDASAAAKEKEGGMGSLLAGWTRRRVLRQNVA